MLRAIPQPPKQLYYLGTEPATLLKRPTIAIVGSRKATPYGKAVTTQLATALANAGAVIVSGLALGVDSAAQQAAVEAGRPVIAVLPSGLDAVYPATHRPLARKILETGGCLISEYAEGMPPLPPQFVARNRIISGLSRAVIITEAAAKSGSLHTAQFALEQGRDVLAVPGNITSPTSAGTNQLIKLGATPLLSADGALTSFGLQSAAANQLMASNAEEAVLLELLAKGITDGDELLIHSKLEPIAFNQTLSMLEIHGKIRSLGNRQWSRT